MATAAAKAYEVISGEVIYGGRYKPGPFGSMALDDLALSGALASDDGMPAWRSGAAVGEWAQITGTTVPGIMAFYCGMAIREEAGVVQLWHGASGGHNDNTSNNIVQACNIWSDAPSAWVTQRAASSASGWDTTGNSGRYMPSDDAPAPSHTYWSPMWVAPIGRYVSFGAYYVGSNVNNYLTVDAFDPATGAWDAAGTWPDIGNTYYAACQDPATSTVYSLQGGALTTWNPSTLVGTQTTLTGGTAQRGGQAYDTTRGRIYHLCSGDNYAGGSSTVTSLQCNPATGACQSISFNSSSAWTDFQAQASGFLTSTLTYDADLDKFYFYNGGTGQTEKVYVITPNGTTIWDMALMSTTGAAPAATLGTGQGGVMTKFQYVPSLKVCVLAVPGQAVYFIRTQ